MIAAQAKPDHATVARFVERHEGALAGVFGEVLGLCARAGLANVAVIAVDGSKLHASAGRDENLDYEQLAREIVEDAKVVDAAEDELYGEARGDELPEQLRTGEGRRAWLRERSASSMSSASVKRGRLRASVPSASRKPGGAWRRSSGQRRERTLLMSITARTAG